MDELRAAPAAGPNMGQPEIRIDGRLKVTGEARYAADVILPDMVEAVLVTAPVARGRVLAMELDEAKAVPGVLAILSFGDVDELERPAFSNSSASSIAPLHEPRIFHDGQIIALVVAESFETAREAAAKVRPTIEPEPPAAGFDSPGTSTVPAMAVSNFHPEDPAVGDAEAALAAADVLIEADYRTATQHHNAIELFSTTCVWDGDELTVHEPSQNIYGFRAEIARQLRMDPAKVRVVSPYIGGAFGSKGPVTARSALVALAARRLGRPVRCVVSRSQGFTTATYRAETRQHIRLGADRDGHLKAFSHEGWEVTSRPDPYCVAGTDTTTRIYAYGAVKSRVELVHADRNTPGYMRSPPETPYMFALECAMDEMAVRLGMDPVEFRRLNDTRQDPIKGTPYSSRSLMACYDSAARAFGWNGRDRQPGQLRRGDWLIGHGCATAVYPTHAGPATARVRLSADGQVLVQSASHEIGTGIRTVAAQMASEQLGVPFAAVSVEMGDSRLPPAPVSGGSCSTASVCSAVMKACAMIREALLTPAVTADDSPLAGSELARLDMRNGMVTAPGGASESVARAFARLGVSEIERYAEWIPEGMPADAVAKLYAGAGPLSGGPAGPLMKFAFGAEFVEVQVHARTREIRVPRIVGAFAGGRIMNTRTARSQLMGGMIWGIGHALLEETEIDPRLARYLNRDISEYMVPVNADIGEVEVLFVPETDPRVNPAGVKGLGELGNVGTAAAVANALYHATGVRLRDLPIRIDRLFAALP